MQAAPYLRVLLSVLLMKDRGLGSPFPARTISIQPIRGKNNFYPDKNYQKKRQDTIYEACPVIASHRPSSPCRTAILYRENSSCTDWLVEPSAEVL